MTPSEQPIRPLPLPVRFSFFFMLGLLILIILLRLATPLLAALFTYLALSGLAFRKKRGGKWLAVAIFLVVLLGAAYALGYFVRQTVHALPEIADKAIPSVIDTAQKNGIELPFTDYDSLKDLAFDTVKGQVRYLGSFAKFARGATSHILFLVAGCVVAISLFLNPQFEMGPVGAGDNLYALCCAAVSRRFGTLYQSFVTVMGAQIIISAINTLSTAVFEIGRAHV